MSDNKELIARLNAVLSWELAGTIQYLHHYAMITGLWRPVYGDFFQDNSKEARKHASLVADKIVALGGVPGVEPATIKQRATLPEMLQAALELEEAALAAWTHALDVAADANLGTQFWIEEMIAAEQQHVDELKKLLKDHAGAAASSGSAAADAG